MRRANASRRGGFTLIEMLVVILIIILLVGLLLPAVQKARDAAMRAQTKSDIAGVGTAIENFKATYDVKYIPTFFILAKDYNPRPNESPEWVAALRESREFYAKVWPKAFIPGFPGQTPVANDVFRICLDGNQCLVFFLGGVPPATSPAAPPNDVLPWPASFQGNRSGFWNSPTSPFAQSQPLALTNGQTSPTQANQGKAPFFDFNPKRVDAPTAHFHDPYWKPTNDPADPTVTMSSYYYFSPKHGNDYDYWGRIYWPVLNPNYVRGPGGVTLEGGYGYMNPHVGLDGKYVEANGFQIVSAGKDQVPSAGGVFANRTTRPFLPDFIWPGTGGYKVPRSGFSNPASPPDPPFDRTGGGADDVANWTGNVLGSDR